MRKISLLVIILGLTNGFFINSYAGDINTALNLQISNSIPNATLTVSHGSSTCMLWPQYNQSTITGTKPVAYQMIWNTNVSPGSTCTVPTNPNYPSSMQVIVTSNDPQKSYCTISFVSCTPPSNYENQQVWNCKDIGATPHGLNCRLQQMGDNFYAFTIN
jgi:hypothetical protein